MSSNISKLLVQCNKEYTCSDYTADIHKTLHDAVEKGSYGKAINIAPTGQPGVLVKLLPRNGEKIIGDKFTAGKLKNDRYTGVIMCPNKFGETISTVTDYCIVITNTDKVPKVVMIIMELDKKYTECFKIDAKSDMIITKFNSMKNGFGVVAANSIHGQHLSDALFVDKKIPSSFILSLHEYKTLPKCYDVTDKYIGRGITTDSDISTDGETNDTELCARGIIQASVAARFAEGGKSNQIYTIDNGYAGECIRKITIDLMLFNYSVCGSF